MTLPDGALISLPPGASTLETLENNIQNMSAGAMKARAVDRFPDIMNGSTGGNPAVDLTPLGILTNIWAGTNSLVANADPADIQGPEDLPGLLLEFIEGLPVIGQLVGLVEAILGTYDGDDEVLLTIQGIFAPIRKLMQMITGIFTGFPTTDQVIVEFPNFIKQPLSQLVDILVDVIDSIPIIGPPVGNALEDLAAMFGLLKDKADNAQDTGENAQFSADHANVGVAQLEAKLAQGNVPGGVLIDDTFNRAGSSIGPDYTLSYFSGAAGSVKIANGNAYWDAVGGDARGCIVQHNTPLGTDYQTVAVIQNNQFPTITNPTHLRLVLRADTAMNNYVEARFSREECSIGKVVAGNYTSLGTAGGRNAAGDRWTFKVGTDVDVRQFILYCNSDAIITVTDTSGTLSNYGASYRKTAFVMKSGTQFVGFAFVQNPPPSIQSYTANDRLAAA